MISRNFRTDFTELWKNGSFLPNRVLHGSTFVRQLTIVYTMWKNKKFIAKQKFFSRVTFFNKELIWRNFYQKIVGLNQRFCQIIWTENNDDFGKLSWLKKKIFCAIQLWSKSSRSRSLSTYSWASLMSIATSEALIEEKYLLSWNLGAVVFYATQVFCCLVFFRKSIF